MTTMPSDQLRAAKEMIREGMDRIAKLSAGRTPPEVYICGQPFRIIRDDDICGLGTHGYISSRDGKIFVRADLEDRYAREVLLHEIIHGIDHALGNGGTDLSQFLEGEKDRPADPFGMKFREPEVIFLSRGLWWTLTDPRNRAVTAWLFGFDS